MKQSHLITPRTLADCQFTSGYRSVPPQTRERPLTVAEVLLACAIGGGFAALLVAWWIS